MRKQPNCDKRETFETERQALDGAATKSGKNFTKAYYIFKCHICLKYHLTQERPRWGRPM